MGTRLRIGRAAAALALMLVFTGVQGGDLSGGQPSIDAAAFPAYRLRSSRIAFDSDRSTGPGVDNPGGDAEIFTMNPDGSLVRQLTHNAATDIRPAWSPDGRKIAFVRRYRGHAAIYTMSGNGANQKNLTNGHIDGADSPDFPNWSPDGKWIAFSVYSFQTHRPEIYKMQADGSHLVNLTGNAPADDFPAWSPDGTRIAFTDNFGQLWTMTPQGTGLTELTQTNSNWYAAWSPDGTRIAVSRDNGAGGPFQIFTMNADGSSLTQRSSFAGMEQRRPTWSPDGALIAFEGDVTLFGGEIDEIYTVTADGKLTNITNNPADDGDPDWGP